MIVRLFFVFLFFCFLFFCFFVFCFFVFIFFCLCVYFLFLQDGVKISTYRERTRTDSFISDYHSRRIKMFLKASLIFILYFFLMLVAVAYTYITVESLVTSYDQPVRSYMSTFKKKFEAPAIIFYPEELDEFLSCDFEVKKDNGDKELPIYDRNNCSIKVFHYFSFVHNQLRKVYVFKGPANVALGEKNHLLFMLNLTNRTVSKLEFRVYDTFDTFMGKVNDESIQSVLLDIEEQHPVYMLAGDFANFVKLDKTIDRTLRNERLATFRVVTNLARLIPRADDNTVDEVDAYIEWADPMLTESQEIISTTIWNTLGSLCAMFLALGKVWMYGKNWILKIWRTYKRNEKYKRRYTEHQDFLKTIEVKQGNEKKEKL